MRHVKKVCTIKYYVNFMHFCCRKYDAGMMTMGHTVVASLMIPPKTKDFQIVGHCSEHCTSLAIPPEGMNIFNILMHTHLQGIFA